MLGHLIYTHNRIDDALVQQELSKGLFGNLATTGGLFLVHAINGIEPSRYQKYLEDESVILSQNRGLYKGAADLINSGVEFFLRYCKPTVRYLLVTASDTWLVNPQFVEALLEGMEMQEQVLAACSWMSVAPSEPRGLATDFFVLDLHWEGSRRVFPLDLDDFELRFADMFWMNWTTPTLETTFQYQYFRFFAETLTDTEARLQADQKLRRLIEREPVHMARGQRRFDWPEIGLYTWHDPKPKRDLIKNLSLDLGPHSHRLVTAPDLSYYNHFEHYHT